MARLLLPVTLLVLLAVPTAAAKEGAQAHLLRPLPLNARAGSRVVVRWSVDVPGRHGTRVPFGADGMFVRLTGRGGSRTVASAAHSGPPYQASVRVPPGGIRAVRFGLMGTACDASRCWSNPMWFPLVGR